MASKITRQQIKAGRELLGMTQKELCDTAGLPLITLRRLEGRPAHEGKVSNATTARLRAVMEGLGVQFLEAGDQADGTGVALREG